MNHKWEVGNTVQFEYCIYQFYPGSLDPDLNISVSQVKWLDPDLLYMYCIKTRIQYPRKITILPHSFISYYFFREHFFLFLQRHYFCIIFFTILFSRCFFQVTYFVLPLGTFYLYCVATSFSFVMLLSYLAMIDWFSLYILNLCADIGALHSYKCFCI